MLSTRNEVGLRWSMYMQIKHLVALSVSQAIGVKMMLEADKYATYNTYTLRVCIPYA